MGQETGGGQERERKKERERDVTGKKVGKKQKKKKKVWNGRDELANKYGSISAVATPPWSHLKIQNRKSLHFIWAHLLYKLETVPHCLHAKQ